MMATWPILSVVTFLPAVGALLIWISRGDDEAAQGARHARVRLVSGNHAVNQPLVVDAVPLWVQTVDRFGNPLSNLEVTYEVKPPERFGAGPLPEEFTNAKLSTDTGDFDSAAGLTAAGGIVAFVRLGDVDATRYFIDAGRKDAKYPNESSVRFTRDTTDFGAGATRAPVGERLGILFFEGGLRLPNNEHLWMGRAGSRLPGTIQYRLVAYQESFRVEQDPQGKYELVGTGRFSTRPVDRALVAPVLLAGDGVFEPTSGTVPYSFYPSPAFPARDAVHAFRVAAQAVAQPALVQSFVGRVVVWTSVHKTLPVGQTLVTGSTSWTTIWSSRPSTCRSPASIAGASRSCGASVRTTTRRSISDATCRASRSAARLRSR